MICCANQIPTCSFVFDRWVLQGDGTLLRDGQWTHLPPKELQVLRLLLSSTGAVVSKHRLLDLVWPQADAAEESLTRCICSLRKYLRDSKRFIATAYGKGYRFTCPVLAFAPDFKPAHAALPAQGEAWVQDRVVQRLSGALGDALQLISSGLMGPGSGSVQVQNQIRQRALDNYLTAQLLRTRLLLPQAPQAALLIVREALLALPGHPLLVMRHALIQAFLCQHVAAWAALEQAGLTALDEGEQGLAFCYVQAGIDPVKSRQHYQCWQGFSNATKTAVPGDLLGDLKELLWQQWLRSTCPWFLQPAQIEYFHA